MLDTAPSSYPLFKISSVELSESSPYAVLSASLSIPSDLDLFFTPFVSNSIDSQAPNDLLSSTLEYFDPSQGLAGSWLPVDPSHGVVIPAGSSELLLRFRWSNDYTYQNSRSVYLFSGEIYGSNVSIDSQLAQAVGVVTFYDNGSVSSVFTADSSSSIPTLSLFGPDDDRPRLSFTSVSISESSPFANVVAYLSRISDQPITFFPYLQDGTATTDSSDYLPDSLEFFDPTFGPTGAWLPVHPVYGVTIPPGQLDVLLRVAVSDDIIFENSEVFHIRCSSIIGDIHPSVDISTLSSTVTILDNGSSPNYFSPLNPADLPTVDPLGANDDRPLLAIGSVSISESSPFAVLSATLSGPSLFPVTFYPYLLAGSADPTLDFIPHSFEFYDVSSGNGGEWCSIEAGSSLTFDPGQTEILLRIAILQDDLYEGIESLSIHAGRIVGPVLPSIESSDIYGTITIVDNGSNARIFPEFATTDQALIDPNGPDDDRPVFAISSVAVSEASPYAIVNAYLSNPSTLPITFHPCLSDGTATSTAGDYIAQSLEYFDTEAGEYGSWISVNPDDGVTINAGQLNVLLRVALANDSLYEELESLTVHSGRISGVISPLSESSDIFGIISIVDNGSNANVFLDTTKVDQPVADSNGPDDDRPVFSISSISVSEASPYAVIVAYLSNPSTFPVTFYPYLTDGTATSTAGDYIAQSLEYFDTEAGEYGSWISVNPDDGVTINAGQLNVLLRVALANDSLYEELESLTVHSGRISGVISPLSESSDIFGIISIVDNGSNANVFLDTTKVDQPVADSNGPDDDRPVFSISSISVSEASPYAVIVAYLSNPSTFPVTFYPYLTDGTATSTAGDYIAQSLEYFDTEAGEYGSWISANPDDGVTINAGQLNVLLRVALANDSLYEELESLTVHSGRISGVISPLSESSDIFGIISIVDNGSNANVFLDTTKVDQPVVDSNGPDEDRPILSISSIAVSEASPYAVVIASLSNPSTKSVSFHPYLGDGTATSNTFDYFAPTLEFLIPGSTQYANWTSADELDGIVFSPGEVQILLRAQLINDFTPESPENFYIYSGDVTGDLSPAQLAPVFGTITIYDDGSVANIFLNSNTSPFPSQGIADDDSLVVAVESLIVSESSPWATFRLLGNPNQNISLAILADGTALAGIDFGTTLSCSSDNGFTWSPYQGGFVSLSASGTLLVRNPIYNDTPPVDEPDEDFYLQVTDVLGQHYLASAFVVDNGTGTVFDAAGSPDEVSVKDDDTDTDLDGLVDLGETSDLNSDTVVDHAQGNVAALAWVNSLNFNAQNRSTPSAPPNSLVAVVAGSSLSQPDPRLQLSAISVDPFTSDGKPDPFTGLIYSSISSVRPISGSLLDRSTAWEPLALTVTQSSVADVDLLTGGVQIDLLIDISRYAAPNGYFNSFLIYNSNSRYGRQGWYQLNRNSVRTQSEFLDLDKDGYLDAVRLRLTDNALGDMSSNIGQISISGMPVLLNPSIPAVSSSSAPLPGLLASRLFSIASFS